MLWMDVSNREESLELLTEKSFKRFVCPKKDGICWIFAKYNPDALKMSLKLSESYNWITISAHYINMF